MGKTKVFSSIVFVVAIILIGFHSCSHYFSKSFITYETIGTVTDKGIKNYDDDSKYLIYTEDPDGKIEVYEITDNLWQGQFNSSDDIYAGIKLGKTYKFTVGGKREEFFSWYPNIYGYEEICVDDGGDDIGE